MVTRQRRWLGSEANVHFAFAAVALLLLLVNLLTPALLNGGFSPNGTFLSQGGLYVGLSGNDNLTFALESAGHVQYAFIGIGLNLSASVAGVPFPGNATTPRSWDRWINSTNALASVFMVGNLSQPGRSEFLVNVTASSSSVLDVGTFAFLFQGSGSAARITVYPIWPLHGPTTIPGGPQPVSWGPQDLPQALLLAQGPAPATGSALALPLMSPFLLEGRRAG